MVNKLLLPQEIETFYIIPALRRSFAQHLREQGMKQKDIAGRLNITSASISQYRSTKRGHQIQFPTAVEEEIKKSATAIKDIVTYLRETQRILSFLRQTKALCIIHRQLSHLPAECIPETVGCLPVKGGCAW